MEMVMPAVVDAHLKTFNTLALNFQDEAYTLAYYLLGDEAQAAEATQTAFAHLYHQHSGLQLDHFRLEVLRRVLNDCRGMRGPFSQVIFQSGSPTPEPGPLDRQLYTLKENERSAVVLIDMLGLGYNEAAQVLGCSKKQVGRLLTQARVSISRQLESRQ